MRVRTVVVRIRLGGLERSSKVCVAETKNTPRAAGLLLLTASFHARRPSVEQDCVLLGAGAPTGDKLQPRAQRPRTHGGAGDRTGRPPGALGGADQGTVWGEVPRSGRGASCWGAKGATPSF